MSNNRTILLGIMAISTTVTLGKSVVHPKVISPRINNYSFPESVALAQWQLSSSMPVNYHQVKPSQYITGDFVAGKHYHYVSGGKSLDIEMRYFANTNGDLKSFITSQTEDLSSGLKQNKEQGSYGLYTNNNKAYLSTCINPVGNSTVTSDQFKRNLMIHGNNPQRIMPWLLGKAEFRDKRCLWAHLSIPLERDVTVDETYKILEMTWDDWQDYWRSHYPDE